jgi:hypothetical protein
LEHQQGRRLRQGFFLVPQFILQFRVPAHQVATLVGIFPARSHVIGPTTRFPPTRQLLGKYSTAPTEFAQFQLIHGGAFHHQMELVLTAQAFAPGNLRLGGF